jgi:hypothetical protein
MIAKLYELRTTRKIRMCISKVNLRHIWYAVHIRKLGRFEVYTWGACKRGTLNNNKIQYYWIVIEKARRWSCEDVGSGFTCYKSRANCCWQPQKDVGCQSGGCESKVGTLIANCRCLPHIAPHREAESMAKFLQLVTQVQSDTEAHIMKIQEAKRSIEKAKGYALHLKFDWSDYFLGN